MSYVVWFLFFLLVIEAFFAHFGRPWLSTLFVSTVLVGISILFFLVVCIGVIFLSTHDFRPDPARLARDSVLSIGFTILAFAVFFRVSGFSATDVCQLPENAVLDSVYFSAVTFSTLGYGDFRPCEASRLWAALEAIIGNLHLGLIVGTAFLFTQNAGNTE